VRPGTPVLALVRSPRMLRRFCLYWGVRAALMPEPYRYSDVRSVRRHLTKHRLVRRGERIVAVSGAPGAVGQTNAVFVLDV
jgi:pyruvate kinase